MNRFLWDSGILALLITWIGSAVLVFTACIISMFRPRAENDALFQHDCM